MGTKVLAAIHADLAGALKPRVVIPAHYDMFAMNLGDVNAFSDYMRIKYPSQKVLVCPYAERVTVP